ncbi:hypothetical protein DN752_02740 [Echinicola strongylocentroti]|uniref:Uncharacterized protein n=1 Tax=Echinicola strongylocentroti TaxID=1795355 RepID=A0A2Z4IEQ6_9BACT|nr:hypothetical protein [Echinicola strongylocentroti]AWW29146.1 hypothetical protein DN752_02740 [Echinicola strongylocentroti]
MRAIFAFLLFFLTFNSFCQGISEKSTDKPEGSEVNVFYSDNSSEFQSGQKPVGVFIDEKFIGNLEVLSFISPDKTETLEIKKEKYEIDGNEYYGKVLIKMKSDYKPNFLTLEGLCDKYLELNENPIIYQIDEKIIENSKDRTLVDENFILSIIVQKVKTSENTEVNLIRLKTKTAENLKKRKEILIRGTEEIGPIANNDLK